MPNPKRLSSFPPSPSPLRFRHRTRRGSKIRKTIVLYMLENHEQKLAKMMSGIDAYLYLFVVTVFAQNQVCVDCSFTCRFLLGSCRFYEGLTLDPLAPTVETQFLNFRVALYRLHYGFLFGALLESCGDHLPHMQGIHKQSPEKTRRVIKFGSQNPQKSYLQGCFWCLVTKARAPGWLLERFPGLSWILK